MKKITGFLFIFYILFTQSVNVYAQANLVQKNLDVPAIHSSVSKDASSNISRRIMTSLELVTMSLILEKSLHLLL